MGDFDYKAYIYNNPLLQEEVEDNGPEEKAFDAEFNALGDQLANAIEDELEGKEEELNEVAGVVGIIGYILLSNTVANMLSKFVKNQATKHDWGTGKEAAEKIYKWTHDNEKAFQAPIRRVVSLFTKDPKKQDQIAKILYAIVILMMAGQAGGNAASYLKKASYLKGGLYSLKSLIKGKEVHTIFKDVISDIVS
tara:strand:+ start:4321 stop:4902 length:582 start_codon:yes stop_codon:yes gene_type:complete